MFSLSVIPSTPIATNSGITCSYFSKDENTLIIAHKRFLETITAEKNTLYPNHKKFINKSNFVLPNLTFSKQIVFNEKPKLHFIHFPGHSYDSSVIWLPQEKILIAGDNVLNSNNGKIAIPYFHWGNPELMLNSLLKIRNLKPNIILPGHGKPTDLKKLSIDILYLKNYFQDSIKCLINFQIERLSISKNKI